MQFIETQFPIARLSAESYKERKANNGQTLTRLGKWWGRKPLILVRAAIIGMLMPASADPRRDREVFLKILTMDDEGVWQRLKPAVKRKTMRAEFDALTYAERIRNCERPENIEGPTPEAWSEINAHLGTTATCLPELVEQLGQKAFGHIPRVGDAFCGGGSIPFEAARIGCEAFGSDLNPVAGLLTWASLHLLGGGKKVQEEVIRVQAAALAEADRQVTEWGIEHNADGERADAYLYCVEVKPEGCDYFIPLAPSWLIGEKSKVVCRWHRTDGVDQLQPEIASVSTKEIAEWKGDSKKKILPKNTTIIESRVIDPFDRDRSWSVEALRGADGLRLWSNDDVVPREGDVFQERLYCIRWVKTVTDDNGKTRKIRRYAAPDENDLAREAKALKLLRERFATWQIVGFIPSKPIVPGYNTDQPIRERGWTHWHHLFTPRQLLTHGLLAESSAQLAKSKHEIAYGLLGIANLANWNSRLSCWLPQGTNEKGNNTFYNQSLNPFFNYSVRPMMKIGPTWEIFDIPTDLSLLGRTQVKDSDARDVREYCDLWITDPPYADAVNYHELGDFFLSWQDKQLTKIFPEWTPDARAELAVRGDGDDFRRSMVEVYKNLTYHMPDNGMQMVMFTHQDPAVWADLGMILWAAGLKATAAWTISTESDSGGFKKGNYVQGTVCLVLRKRLGSEPGFLDEIYPLVEDEVRRQIDSMQALDEGSEPNFNDADYQLAAYAAALKVLTQYGNIDGRDVEHEVFAARSRNEKSDFQAVIERALRIACDYLVPRGLDHSWRDLSLAERYYLRALDIESRGERRKGMYEELARGFGLTDIKPLLESDKANGARMKIPTKFAAALLGTLEGGSTDNLTLPTRRGRTSSAVHPFATAPLRHLLFAVRETSAADNNPESGRQYLRDTFGQGYWSQRERFVRLLEWLSQLGNAVGMEEWQEDSAAARILAGRLRNDQA